MPNVPRDNLRVCRACGLPPDLCACALLPRLSIDFRMVAIQHVSELNKGTNTVRLLHAILPELEIHVFGDPQTPYDPSCIATLPKPVVLFPRGDDVLEPADLEGGSLILLDGTWSQGRRMARRVPGLETMRFVRLPEGPPSNWRLRNPPEEHMLCTLEAASRAVRISGDGQTADAMLRSLRIVELHSLHSRGFMNREALEAALSELAGR